MNNQIRKLGIAMIVLFGALFVQLNFVQVVRADKLANAPGNTRVAVRDFSHPRGVIQSADGVVLARTVEVDTGFKRLRQYPEGALFAHLTGYFSFTFGAEGVERAYAAELAGRAGSVRLRTVGQLFANAETTGNVTITVTKRVQQAATAALGGRKGAVVAIDPTTGAILALVGSPSFDPNPLSAHDQKAVRQSWDGLQADPNKPLLPRPFRERYAPGSTFKLVTAATALDQAPDLAVKDYPRLKTLDLPDTNRDLPNFGGGTCGGTLGELLRVSCNTGFAQLGLDLGAARLASEARQFGFGTRPPLDLPAVARSVFPDAAAFANKPGLAKSAIGQQDVAASPLQMALVAAGIANGGVIMQPHVMAEIRDAWGTVVEKAKVQPWRQACSATTAAALRDMMIEVAAHGTATRAQVPGITVAAKTGTAQTTGDAAHAWLVGFAPAEAPRVAVAVIVESQPGVAEATGGRVAAPIAREVLAAALAG